MKKRKEYLFYCYHCPDRGEYHHNGYTYTFGEDYRNVKRYKEYLDCGFNVVQARGGSETGNEYKGFWEGSGCQKVFEEYTKAGGDKIFVTDRQLDGWIVHDHDVVGEGKRFASDDELDEAVKASMDGYRYKKGFFGVQLLDEPRYKNFPAYGQVARSIKRVCPTAEIQANLLPLGTDVELIIPTAPTDEPDDPTAKFVKSITNPTDKFEAYEKYVNDFVTLTNLDYVLFDEYPFRREYIISGNTIPNYQLVGRICQKRGLEFKTVLQSFSQIWSGNMQQRYMTESDMYWQTNLALGFGCKEFSFYTYFAKPDFDYKTGFGETDGGAFINLDGSKTALYFYTKRIIAEMKKFSKIALPYSYQNSYVITEKGKSKDDYDWTRYLYENETYPYAVDVQGGVGLITKQLHENGKDELYMVENIGNVKGELFDGVGPMQVRIALPKGKKNFYFRGKKIRVKADKDGKYPLSLKVGDAVFVELKK